MSAATLREALAEQARRWSRTEGRRTDRTTDSDLTLEECAADVNTLLDRYPPTDAEAAVERVRAVLDALQEEASTVTARYFRAEPAVLRDCEARVRAALEGTP